jgi:hypothetical protein
MRDQSCEECNRLWRDYAIATNADIKLNGQVEVAALTHDAGLSQRLAPLSESATHDRQSLRQRIREHEVSHD